MASLYASLEIRLHDGDGYLLSASPDHQDQELTDYCAHGVAEPRRARAVACRRWAWGVSCVGSGQGDPRTDDSISEQRESVMTRLVGTGVLRSRRRRILVALIWRIPRASEMHCGHMCRRPCVWIGRLIDLERLANALSGANLCVENGNRVPVCYQTNRCRHALERERAVMIWICALDNRGSSDALLINDQS